MAALETAQQDSNIRMQEAQSITSSPVLIPLHNDFTSSSDGLPEWAMIELNGQLMAPPTVSTTAGKENPGACDSSLMIGKDQVELGSVRFVKNVSVK